MKLIKNGKLITMTGKNYDNADILISNGKIVEISENIIAKPETEIIDATNKYVLPGLIDAHCHIGIIEDGIGIEGYDTNESTNPSTPYLRAIDAINPMERGIREARENGVTTVCTGPGSANVIGGTFSILKTVGKRIDDMIVKEGCALKIAFGENPKRIHNARGEAPITRMATAAILRKELNKAKIYKEKMERYKDDLEKRPDYDFELENLVKVLNKEITLKAHAHRADDIFTAIRIANEFDVNITIDHCTEGHLIAEELAKEAKPVMVGPLFIARSKPEMRELSFKTPGILSKAGVKLCIISDGPEIPVHYLMVYAGIAAREGLGEEEALKAITIYPAEILGISDKVGSLEVNKDADIVIYDGHPFNLTTKVVDVLISGKSVFEI